MDLRTPVTDFPTVGGGAAAGLTRLGLHNVRDLLFHFPYRHEDRREVTPVAEAAPGKAVVVEGILEVLRADMSFRRYPRGTRPVVVTSAVLRDASGTLPVRWYHQRYLTQTYRLGNAVVLVGTVNEEGVLVAPEIERVLPGKVLLHSRRLVPVYPETRGITSRQLRYLVARALPAASLLREYLPAQTKASENLLDFPTAVRQMHFPADAAELTSARERLSFDELFLLQLGVLQRKAERAARRAAPREVSETGLADAIAQLPFTLTPSQERAFAAICADLRKPTPMNRLLAGDVGSGKTVVAGLAALAVARAGGRSALLAPTELLVHQHAETLRILFAASGLRISRVTAETSARERAALAEGLRAGSLDVVLGTHTLLASPLPGVAYALVIVDEQHRFGVRQRADLAQLGEKGTAPHFLSLSATPIPRTLQLTAYGDLEVSPLEPRPGQRHPRTEVVPPRARNTMVATLRNRIASGGQVFVVCPRVEEDPEDTERRSVEAEYRRLRRGVLRDVRIARLHGRLPAAEKERVLADFRARKLDLIVASTVVEVGVDVPGADTLLVEGAERFGLATLHQLRGRIGRRGQEAHCFLATETEEPSALDRLAVLQRTTSGLAVAEEDLRRRGPGEMYGTRQHGGITLKVATLSDIPFLHRVRRAAEELLKRDRELRTAPLLAARTSQLGLTAHLE